MRLIAFFIFLFFSISVSASFCPSDFDDVFNSYSGHPDNYPSGYPPLYKCFNSTYGWFYVQRVWVRDLPGFDDVPSNPKLYCEYGGRPVVHHYSSYYSTYGNGAYYYSCERIYSEFRSTDIPGWQPRKFYNVGISVRTWNQAIRCQDFSSPNLNDVCWRFGTTVRANPYLRVISHGYTTLSDCCLPLIVYRFGRYELHQPDGRPEGFYDNYWDPYYQHYWMAVVDEDEDYDPYPDGLPSVYCDNTSSDYSFCIENLGEYQQEFIDQLDDSFLGINDSQLQRSSNILSAINNINIANSVSFTDLDDADESQIVSGISQSLEENLSFTDSQVNSVNSELDGSMLSLNDELTVTEDGLNTFGSSSADVSYIDSTQGIADSVTMIESLLDVPENCSDFTVNFPTHTITLACDRSIILRSVLYWLLYLVTVIFVFKTVLAGPRHNPKLRN